MSRTHGVASPQRRGFTLMEAAVTLALGTALIFAAVVLQVMLTRSYTSARRISELSDRTIALGGFLSRELLTIGGNGTGAAASIYVEHNCAARGEYPACPTGADRVTLFPAVSFAPQCRISHVDTSVTPPRLSFWQQSAAGPKCCLNDEKNGIHSDGNPVDGPFVQYLKQHVILQKDGFRKPAMLIAEHGAPGATTAPAPSSYDDADWDNDGKYTDSRCTFRLIDVVPTSMRVEPTSAAQWLDGKVTPVDMRVLFIDSRLDPPELVMHIERDDSGGGATPTLENAGTGSGAWNWSDTITPEPETLTVMDGVYDLQVVFGYDSNDDGVIATSELRFDAATETSRDFAQDHLLRTLRVDAVLGVKVLGLLSGRAAASPANPTVQSLSLVDHAMRSMSITVTPRNTAAVIGGG